MNKVLFYTEITKSQESDDGDFITVGGIASSNIVDSDGDIVTTEAMKNARDNYLKFPAIREMHQPIAAGKCTKFEILENGDTYIEAEIYDKETIKKIKAGVLRAFSIGGKALKKVGKTILELILSEISVVDRPANTNAIMTFYKADLSNFKEENIMQVDNETQTTQPEVVVAEDVSKTVEVQAVVEPVAEVPVVAEPEIKKGLDDVARLTGIINDLVWLQNDMDWEKEYEGDNSTLPNQLKEAIKSLFGILSASVKEETDEIATMMDAEKADTNNDVEKAGKRNSKSDMDKIQQIHDLALSLGACSPSANPVSTVQLADTNNDLEKSFKASLDEKETIIKSISAEKDALISEKENLIKRVKELEAIPVQKPTSVHIPVSKDEDNGEITKSIKPVYKSDGQIDEVATLMKATLFGKK